MSTAIGPAGRIGQFFIESKLTPLLVIASLILGVFAVMLTPSEEEPQIVVPMVDIFVGLPGADPEEVENRVTVPLEKRMKEIPGVEYVYSASMPSVSMVTVRFLVGQDQERSLVKVYDKLASGLDRMPQGATPPLVKTRTIDDVPVLGLTLWSPHHEGFELRRIAAELGRELSQVIDVSDVRITGGQRRQLSLQLDQARMAAFQVDPGALVQALEMQNAAAPAGSYESADSEIKVEAGTFLRTAGDVAALVVGVHQGRPVYLRDVARIEDGPEEPADYVMFTPGAAAASKGIPAPGEGPFSAVTVSLAKRKGADAHKVTLAALARANDLKGRLIPADVNLTVTRDYGETAANKAGELLNHLVIAIISVVIFIALTLGWRGGLVVAISVPVTFALTLFVYYVFGYTLNRVTLFALIFVTGLVVDDSIIVVENTVRHFSMKKLPPLQAAVAAVNEVGNPTILATLTVIASVLPMAVVRGLMGPYMRPMPVGASLAMLFSLLVALITAPYFSFRLLKGGPAHAAEEGYDIEKTTLYRIYKRVMLPLIRRPALRWGALLGTTALLLLSLLLFPLKGVTVKMLPFDNKSELQLIVDMPEGTTLERTAAVARDLAAYVGTVPEVTDVQVYAGTAAPFNFNGLVRHYDLRRGSNVADVQVNFVPKDQRGAQSHDLARRIRPQVEEIARRHQAAVKITEIPPGPPVMSTLVAEIYGPSQEARLILAKEIRKVFESTPGVVDIDWLVEADQPKKVFEIDREKAALHGVPAGQIARTLRAVLAGEDAGLLHDAREIEPVPIRLQLPRSHRSSAAELAAIKVVSLGGRLVPLGELIKVREITEPVSRHRKNLMPVVYVTGDVAGREESPVYAILKMAKEIDKLRVPGGGNVKQFYTAGPPSQEVPAMKWDGEWHITYEVFRDLGTSFGVVLVLMYMLIIGWFKSFKVPLTMMLAIPLSLVGILPFHWLLGTFFTATTMIGFIALAGIMVRNSVLLIDFINMALAGGKSLAEAVIESGAVRFRPIVLTAGTNIVGSFMILFDPIFGGLAVALMAGSAASTALTLIVVPLVHYMIEKRRYKNPLPAEWK